jgi:NADPH-dependent 2,4-dienoyl-CoA reductase/sulfur reductase-like enzyme
MSRQLGDLGAWDVVVVGSGSAGSTAAVSAARNGARTLLVEKLPFLGGVSTAVLDTFYGFYTPGSRARKVVGGVADDVVAGLRRLGPVLERPNTYGAGTGVTYLAEHLKVVWESLVTGAGAAVLLHAFVQDAEVAGGRVRRLVVATKAGLAQLRAGVVVDASGDADVCHFAGLGYELAGDPEPAQTLTTSFRLVNVDTDRRRGALAGGRIAGRVGRGDQGERRSHAGGVLNPTDDSAAVTSLIDSSAGKPSTTALSSGQS